VGLHEDGEDVVDDCEDDPELHSYSAHEVESCHDAGYFDEGVAVRDAHDELVLRLGVGLFCQIRHLLLLKLDLHGYESHDEEGGHHTILHEQLGDEKSTGSNRGLDHGQNVGGQRGSSHQSLDERVLGVGVQRLRLKWHLGH